MAQGKRGSQSLPNYTAPDHAVCAQGDEGGADEATRGRGKSWRKTKKPRQEGSRGYRRRGLKTMRSSMWFLPSTGSTFAASRLTIPLATVAATSTEECAHQVQNCG